MPGFGQEGKTDYEKILAMTGRSSLDIRVELWPNDLRLADPKFRDYGSDRYYKNV
jgi:hypothetical protein